LNEVENPRNALVLELSNSETKNSKKGEKVHEKTDAIGGNRELLSTYILCLQEIAFQNLKKFIPGVFSLVLG